LFVLGRDPEQFPSPERADANGLLAVGGDLSPRRLLAAYSRGIFPWYDEGMPILWHSPDPRFVLEPKRLHVSKSLRKAVRRGLYQVRLDTAFEQVVDACAEVRRPGQLGTWITSEMREAYVRLHRLGYAHSAESWCEGALAGGLYGVSLGSIFFGESMFALRPDSSKVAFVQLVEKLQSWSCTLIDCQQETEHLRRFGAVAWPRKRFLRVVEEGLRAPGHRGRWSLEGPRPI
jgi:leucyl/phenylalanyl-tRNA---protein transferase